MMTIQKPKRMWQKKKDYMRKKTIRGLRRKGKRILQSFDDGIDDKTQRIYQDGDYYFAGPDESAATTKVTPYIQRLPNDKSTWDFIDDSGKLYTTKYSDDQLKELYRQQSPHSEIYTWTDKSGKEHQETNIIPVSPVDPVGEMLVETAIGYPLFKGVGWAGKQLVNDFVKDFSYTKVGNWLRNKALSNTLNKNVKAWDGTVGPEYFNFPNKKIDLTPKTSISKEEVDVPFKGKLQDYITESGESMIYDDGQYVLKEKSLYDVNSSIDKLHQNVSRDLAMNQIPGVQPIEYLGYKVNTNPQKVINGLTGKVETKLNKTYDPIYRQRKLIPLDDPKTKVVYQPNPYRLLDQWGIKHDKDFGYVNDITFSDFGLNNWGVDTYGRYRLFDPMIHDFSNGKDIHIKKANRGKFTEAANEHNMGVQEFARQVLSAPKGKYSPTLRKRANFARNFAH